ncbi:hypothetical protein [Aurantimonas sp. 22II-16-19i]|uniref:hypothetical protein n=1 Tax=Aurantimonas sp. 22II-16-19i TaxID=1317114 RepID=UPI0009F7A511|nr:hypothetical protein [Aurantimonas sp. 22II-16-19i]ORE98365.1 hypothetical protein ATO4_02585 [Aurantimonas sp. 22II-16-19i]
MALSRRTFIAACALAPLGCMQARAAAGAGLDDPAQPVLAVSRNGTRLAALSRAELAAMPQARIATRTPWNDTAVVYEGPLLADLLARFGDGHGELRLLALNDYMVTADAALLTEAGAILAVKQDGTFLTMSRKGPVFVMFPFDDDPRLQSQPYYSRAVWQLVEIELL